MKREDVLAIAKRVAESNSWPWLEPVSVNRRKRWLFWGPTFWIVLTNSDSIGMNVYIEIEDVSEKILRSMLRSR